MRLDRRQRPLPTVPPEGPAAGGGGPSFTVDPGVPLGPSLIATWLTFHGPQVRMASRRAMATAKAISAAPRVEFSFWCSSMNILRYQVSVLRLARLQGLDRVLGLGPRLVDRIARYRNVRRVGPRRLVDDGAPLGQGVQHDIERRP